MNSAEETYPPSLTAEFAKPHSEWQHLRAMLHVYRVLAMLTQIISSLLIFVFVAMLLSDVSDMGSVIESTSSAAPIHAMRDGFLLFLAIFMLFASIAVWILSRIAEKIAKA